MPGTQTGGPGNAPFTHVNPNSSSHKGTAGSKASGTVNPFGPKNPGATAVSGTGIGLLFVAGLGAIALANTKIGPVVIAALSAAVLWNGQEIIKVIGGKAPTTGVTITNG